MRSKKTPKERAEAKAAKKDGRSIAHEKTKATKPKRVFMNVNTLKDVGLEVKYKSVSNLSKQNEQIGEDSSAVKDVYVPQKVLEARGQGDKFKSIKDTTAASMLAEKTLFAKAKPASIENLEAPKGVKPQPFPKKSLTRLLTGDVKPEWIVGLGKMKEDKVTPADGYKDCFVSSLEEYEKKGINFDSEQANDPVQMASKLDLMDSDVQKVKDHGAWLIEIHPSSKLAIPSDRKNEWNPGYVEGGYTGSGQQEWVTPNIGLDEEARAGMVKIFKMSPDGKTTEWKFFQGKMYPNTPNDVNGPVEGSYNHAINAHIKSNKNQIN